MPVMRFKSAVEALVYAKKNPGDNHAIAVVDNPGYYSLRAFTAGEWAQALTGGFVRFLQRENIVAWEVFSEPLESFETIGEYVDAENAKLQAEYDKQGTWTGD